MRNTSTQIALVALVAGTVLAVAVAAPAQESRSFQVIVHPSNQVGSMSAKDLSGLFLKRTTTWDDGTKVLPVDLKPGSAVRQAFTEAVHGKPVKSILNYWQAQVFSGRNSPPSEEGSDAEVIAIVRANPGAVGYVSANALLVGVEAIEVR